MAKYSYVTTNLVTGTILEEIPFSNVTWGKTLNGPGGFGGSLASRHPKCTSANLSPSKTGIYVLRNDDPVWGGVIWTAKKDTTGNIVFGAEGLWSYFRRRRIRHTQTFAAVDQLTIAQTLLNYAQNPAYSPNGNIGVTVGSEVSGVVRDRTYFGYDRKALGEAIEQLGSVANGFDFDMIHVRNGSGFDDTVRLWYPRKGSRTNTVWEVGVHCDTDTWEIDGTKQATQMDALGLGDGDNLLIATDVNLSGEDPLLDDTVRYKDVSVAATLQQYANEWRIRRQAPFTFPEVALRPTIDTSFGSFDVGDEIQLRGNDGFVNLDGWYTVVNYEVKVSDEGDESTKVGFRGAEAMP